MSRLKEILGDAYFRQHDRAAAVDEAKAEFAADPVLEADARAEWERLKSFNKDLAGALRQRDYMGALALSFLDDVFA